MRKEVGRGYNRDREREGMHRRRKKHTRRKTEAITGKDEGKYGQTPRQLD